MHISADLTSNAVSNAAGEGIYRWQNSDTKKGTLKSTRMPCKMATGMNSLPEYCVMAGSNTSIELTPAADMGASRPKYFRMSGAPSKAIISRRIFASRAIVPSSVAICKPTEGSLNCVMRIDESE